MKGATYFRFCFGFLQQQLSVSGLVAPFLTGTFVLKFTKKKVTTVRQEAKRNKSMIKYCCRLKKRRWNHEINHQMLKRVWELVKVTPFELVRHPRWYRLIWLQNKIRKVSQHWILRKKKTNWPAHSYVSRPICKHSWKAFCPPGKREPSATGGQFRREDP